ncbi:TetR/AcrR family transcriptional regulator [Thiobacter aerophilum]|uniref:TetR/AcrR family transcriptional regulator n=1 Tax=Thiobacter aerophilum TaxID=3121275 RepID=A0ABV0EKD6_9BURK
MAAAHAAPDAADTRQRVLEAACAAFREEGYQVSIERIAARAQVARQTLYNHFASKEALFAAVMRHAVQSILVTLEGEGDLRTTLLDFAQAYRARVLSAEGIAIFRTMVAEAPRFPELARQFFEEGPQHTRQGLARYLARAMAAGRLRRDDPAFAAELLTAMLSDYDRLKRLFGLSAEPEDEAKAARVVDAFLRLFAPPGRSRMAHRRR